MDWIGASIGKGDKDRVAQSFRELRTGSAPSSISGL